MHEDAALVSGQNPKQQTDKPGFARTFADLRPRIISGVTLGVLGLALISAGPKPFGLLVLVVALLMSWEWARIVRGRRLDISFLIHAIAACAGTVLAAVNHPLIGVLALLVGAITLLPLNIGKEARLSAFGVLYVGLPAIILIWLRASEPYGFIAVLYLLTIVCVADTAAFLAGRTIGGFKLWPSISPNKTWSGAVAAVAAGGAAGALLAVLSCGTNWVYALPVALALGLVSQLGDLAESALKRGFNVKDASDLIPGHGGFMDRMDGIVAVAMAAGLLAILINPSKPSQALMLGF